MLILALRRESKDLEQTVIILLNTLPLQIYAVIHVQFHSKVAYIIREQL